MNVKVINNITLERGDKVSLIAPASAQKEGEKHFINAACDCLARWGLVVENKSYELVSENYLSATDNIRYQQLKESLLNPNIKAIFITRGGYGTARLIKFLEKDINCFNKLSSKLFVGFSDITLLHLFFTYHQFPIQCVHGPNLATKQFLDEQKFETKNRWITNQLLLFDRIFKKEYELIHITPLYANRKLPDDWQKYKLTGGCLSIVVNSLGTLFEINTDNKYLMLEETGEKLYALDRMLTHLRNSGKFEKIKGIIIGSLLHCGSNKIKSIDMLKSYFLEDDFPIGITEEFGHGIKNIAWNYS